MEVVPESNVSEPCVCMVKGFVLKLPLISLNDITWPGKLEDSGRIAFDAVGLHSMNTTPVFVEICVPDIYLPSNTKFKNWSP